MNTQNEENYLNLLRQVIACGEVRSDRTGVGTRSVFGTQTVYNLQDGYPLLTTKQMAFKSIIAELLWFLRGDTNIAWLLDRGCTIWNEWADEHGNLGPVYGAQWRSWCSGGTLVAVGAGREFRQQRHDQIATLIEGIRHNPWSRRHIVSAWNVGDLPLMALPPCHMMFQCYVTNDGHLDLHMYQRSADLFLGVPFNIASYAALMMILVDQVGVVDDLETLLIPGRLVHTIGDAHIYLNHMDQVEEQLSRDPLVAPNLSINHREKIADYDVDDFSVVGYECHEKIAAEVAV